MRSYNSLAKNAFNESSKSFEIKTYIKGRVNVNISGSQTYNELYQIHRTSVVFKTLVFRLNKRITSKKF